MMIEHTRGRLMTKAEHIYSINPSTEKIMGFYQLHTREQIEKMLREAQKAFLAWREETFPKRSNLEAAKRMTCRIEAGQVFINGMVVSDPRLPFDASVPARSLSELGIREFINIQTIWIGPSTR
jgi:acyl-CoA reductase-like NAD-dependent aldehyde dehydrogenase